MFARQIIIRTLGVIAVHGYVGKTDALIHSKKATSNYVKETFTIIPKITPLEEASHGVTADNIINWLGTVKNSEFLTKCAHALKKADTEPDSAYGLLAYTPVAYEATVKRTDSISKITAPSQLIGTVGETIERTVTVLNIDSFKTYDKISFVDNETGALLTTFRNEKTLQSLKVGGIIKLSGKVAKHISTIPKETRLSNVKIIRAKKK